MNVDELLDRAKAGELAEAELGDPQEELVAGQLDGFDDDLAGLALWILCEYWKLDQKYREHIWRWLHGVPGDVDGWRQSRAIFVAGESARRRPDRDLLRALLRLAEEDDGDPFTREAAVRALARALGDAWQDIPAERRVASEAWARGVIARARDTAA